MSLLKNYRVIILLTILMLSLLVVGLNGLRLGIDFSGGTLFQIHLAEAVESPDKMSTVVSTISQRLDWTGLRDTKVNAWGKEFVVAQIAETDPETIEKIESLLQKQGRFEVTIDGNTIFTGEDIIDIIKDPNRGYGVGRPNASTYQWTLPFTLKSTAALRFRDMSFHRCIVVGYKPGEGIDYDCDYTYFFIDRPRESILVVPLELYETEKTLLLQGSQDYGVSGGVKIEEIIQNAALPHFIVSKDGFSEQQLQELDAVVGTAATAIVTDDIAEEIASELEQRGFELKKVSPETDRLWVFTAVGLREMIALSKGVAQMDIARPEDAEIMSTLQIFGNTSSLKLAQQRLSELQILLESGSLSVSVESISKDTISPLLGEDFLLNTALMGLAALAAVAIILFVRYRVPKLAAPILLTGFSEVVIVLGVASLIRWNLDLAAVAGIIAAVGTGVDSQIVITDELMKGTGEADVSLINRVKRAFFIIMASASTTIATMLPIIVLGFGLGKLVGFAFTTIVGVLIGVFITRPAFGEIAKSIISKQQ